MVRVVNGRFRAPFLAERATGNGNGNGHGNGRVASPQILAPSPSAGRAAA